MSLSVLTLAKKLIFIGSLFKKKRKKKLIMFEYVFILFVYDEGLPRLFNKKGRIHAREVARATGDVINQFKC